jgi:hypothetical protein
MMQPLIFDKLILKRSKIVDSVLPPRPEEALPDGNLVRPWIGYGGRYTISAQVLEPRREHRWNFSRVRAGVFYQPK